MLSLGYFHNFTHYLNMFIVDSDITQEMLDHALESALKNDAMRIGVSKLGYPSSYCIKALCNRSDLLLELRDQLLF